MMLDIGVPSGGPPKSLEERIASVRAQIAAAAIAAGRDPMSITLLGVTKKQSTALVAQAVRAGLHDLGENYVQEAQRKFAEISPEPEVRKHYIGHVQTNKAKAIVETFDVVQSIDRLEAGRAIAKASTALGKPISALIQVNVSPTDRFGVVPADAVALARTLRAEGLLIDGVMAIAPVTDDRAAITAAFSQAAAVFEHIGGTMLSIGMSGDFREAIACGSTMVRIGTALFGART